MEDTILHRGTIHLIYIFDERPASRPATQAQELAMQTNSKQVMHRSCESPSVIKCGHGGAHSLKCCSPVFVYTLKFLYLSNKGLITDLLAMLANTLQTFTCYWRAEAYWCCFGWTLMLPGCLSYPTHDVLLLLWTFCILTQLKFPNGFLMLIFIPSLWPFPLISHIKCFTKGCHYFGLPVINQQNANVVCLLYLMSWIWKWSNDMWWLLVVKFSLCLVYLRNK